MTSTVAGSASAPPPTRRPRLVLTGVSKRWRRRGEPLFDGIDLVLPPGTLAVVVGRNGAGKTTLLRIVAGLIAADAGDVMLEGLSARQNRREYQRRVGFLAAGSTGLYARLTVAQHLEYWARLALVPVAERKERIGAALERFDLRGIASSRADRISMGQRQRLRLALAFLHGPGLLLLDEPWSSLDDEGLLLLNEAVAEFATGGGAGIFCAPTGHDLDLIPADCVYALDNGRLAAA